VKESIDTIISKIKEKNECQYENKYAYNLDTHSRIFSRIEESIPILLEIKAVLGGVNETYILLSTAIINKTLNDIQEYSKFLNLEFKSRSIGFHKDEDSLIYRLLSLDMTDDFEKYFQKIESSIFHEMRSSTISSKPDIKFEKLLRKEIDIAEYMLLCKEEKANRLGDFKDYKYGKIPDLGFIILKKEFINMDKNSKLLPKKNTYLYQEDIRYIHLKMKIKVLKEKTLKFKINYINAFWGESYTKPFSLIDIDQKKIIYSLTQTIKINKNTEEIIFDGYGNGKKNVYNLDKGYYVSVYVDDFLIFSEKIEIGLSPQKRLIRLKERLDKNITEIENNNYFEEEIEQEEQKILKIKKWKLFRTQKTKNKEIREQKNIIQSLYDKQNKKRENEILKIKEEYEEILKEIEEDIEEEKGYLREQQNIDDLQKKSIEKGRIQSSIKMNKKIIPTTIEQEFLLTLLDKNTINKVKRLKNSTENVDSADTEKLSFRLLKTKVGTINLELFMRDDTGYYNKPIGFYSFEGGVLKTIYILKEFEKAYDEIKNDLSSEVVGLVRTLNKEENIYIAIASREVGNMAMKMFRNPQFGRMNASFQSQMMISNGMKVIIHTSMMSALEAKVEDDEDDNIVMFQNGSNGVSIHCNDPIYYDLMKKELLTAIKD
jgi:hypothetical protein